MSDSEDTMTVEFESRSKSSRGVARSTSQDDQLTKARNVALTNRRMKTKEKLEARLIELRGQLGNIDNEHLEKAVKHLIKIEEHHRSKLLASYEKQNEQIRRLNDSVSRLADKVEQIRAPQIRTKALRWSRGEWPTRRRLRLRPPSLQQVISYARRGFTVDVIARASRVANAFAAPHAPDCVDTGTCSLAGDQRSGGSYDIWRRPRQFQRLR